MIEKLVAAALRLPIFVFGATVALVAMGIYAYGVLDVEAYPNPVPPLVEVITQPEGLGAEEVERIVTVPLEIALAGMPGLHEIRSQSIFGLSDVKCYFDWGTDYTSARQEVINRLSLTQLPYGLSPTLSPWNSVGEIYRYSLEGSGYTLADLKTAQDWILERLFRQAPGVIDVVSFGGLVKEYHVEVDPFRMRGQSVTLSDIVEGISNANRNVGGQRMVLGEQSYVVRGIGLLRDVHDIDSVVISTPQGTPVRVREVARTRIGAAPRLGMVGRDDRDDIVQGVVLMRYGAETPKTLANVHAKVHEIVRDRRLPPGVRIVPYYDRGDLVHLTVKTVRENVLIGIALVAFVLFLFLGSVRAALVTAINIPLALCCAFCGLVLTHTSANLLSLGAIDFGIVIDSTVIMIENIFRHLGPSGTGDIRERVRAAAREVGVPMIYSTVIIAVSFLPLFTMTGVSGVIFAPMARTYAFAIGGAICLALTLTPVLASRVLRADEKEEESRLMRFLHRLYAPLFDAALRSPRKALLFQFVPLVLCVVLFAVLGGEFMPKLEEGNIWIRATFPLSISLEESAQHAKRMRRIVRGCPSDFSRRCVQSERRHPEVVTAVSQVGRPDDGTDVTGFNNIEIFAPLRSFDDAAWHGRTKADLVEELTRELGDAFPGAVFNFSQMISDNVQEGVSGVKGENSIKVFGPDIEVDERIALRIVRTLSRVRGVTDLGILHSQGQPSVRISPDRRACSRYGLNTGEVGEIISAAIGGRAVTEVYEGQKRFDLTVRWEDAYRGSVEAIRELLVSTPDGGQVPLGQIARIDLVTGPANVFRQNGRRYVPIKFSVRGRDLSSTIAEAKQRIAREVHVPYDVKLDWSGEINELARAQERLALIIPLTLLLITFFTYAAVRNWLDTTIVLVEVPVAVSGGLLALFLTRTNFSVSAAMGFISVLGIAIQDAILVVTYFQRLRGEGQDIVSAARQAAEKRFRPVLMTALVATLGLFPAAVSHGIGSQTQKPLAIVVIGGSILLAVLTRLVQPPLLVLAHQWLERRRARG